LLLLLGLLHPRLVEGQTHRTVPDGPQCEACPSRIDLKAKLVAPEPYPALLTSTQIVSLPSGGFSAAPVARPGSILRFTEDGGAPVEVIGRFGKGPRELGFITTLASAGDSLLVADTNGRVSVFTASGEWARSQPNYAGETLDLTIQHGQIVAESLGLGPVYLRADGSFRAFDPLLAAGQVGRNGRFVMGEGGGLWRVHLNDLGMERFDSLGRRTEVLDRRAPWFVTRREARRDGRRWTYYTEDVEAAGRSRLAILYSRTDRRWRPSTKQGRPTSAEGGVRLSVSEVLERLDWYIEVVDVGSASLYLRLDLPDRYVGGLLPGKRFYSVFEEETGLYGIEIWGWGQDGGPGPRSGRRRIEGREHDRLRLEVGRPPSLSGGSMVAFGGSELHIDESHWSLETEQPVDARSDSALHGKVTWVLGGRAGPDILHGASDALAGAPSKIVLSSRRGGYVRRFEHEG
jgi:hypothetical protein